MFTLKLPITSITPFTFQDYPEHTACILWFSGCNMACSYCHNPELVNGEYKKLPHEDVVKFLESRAGLLEGVVLSGGECTLSPALPAFASYLKKLDYKVKVDTNGTNPDMLALLLEAELIDFVALDFKAPDTKFSTVTLSDEYDAFKRSLALVCESNVGLEIRITVHPDLLDEDDINTMIGDLENLRFRGTYYLQKVRTEKTLGNLDAPTRMFDVAKLTPTTFDVRLRNF